MTELGGTPVKLDIHLQRFCSELVKVVIGHLWNSMFIKRSLLIVLYSSFYHMVLKALCDRFGLKRLQCFLSNGVGSTVCL